MADKAPKRSVKNATTTATIRVVAKTSKRHNLDIHQDDHIDEELVGSWIQQASKLPGWAS